MAKYGRSFTRIPRINPQRGGGGSRANIMRSYLGGTDAFGTVQMSRPNQPLQMPEISAPRISPTGVVREDRQQDRTLQRTNERIMEQNAENNPQGAGAVSVNWQAPTQAGTGPFAGLTYAANLQPQLDELYRNTNLGSASERSYMLNQLAGLLGYPVYWDSRTSSLSRNRTNTL